MGFGISIFTITLGAILKFAITAESGAVDINMIGVILMIVGAATFGLQIAFSKQLSGEGPPRANGPRGNGNGHARRDTSYDGDD